MHIRPHTNSGDHQIRRETSAFVEDDPLFFDGGDFPPHVKGNALVLVNIPDESSELGTQHSLQWKRFRTDHTHAQASLDQRGGDLQCDETRTNDNGLLRRSKSFDDRSTIPKSAEVKDPFTAGNLESYRRRAGREEQTAVFATVSIAQMDLPRFDVDGFGLDTGQYLNALRVVKLSRVERKPFLWRISGQVIFGEVAPVVRCVRIGVDHGDRSAVRLTAQHL